MSTPKVVILCLENRSFDEYFGTFPGAKGFYDPAGAAIFPQAGFVGTNGPIHSLYPFRTSVFSSAAEQINGCNHYWTAQQQAFVSGNLNGWAQAQGATLTATMGYYASNDIPYLWQLAQSFLLCDNYFCSVLGPTWPNRIFLMSGTVFGATPPPNGTIVPYDTNTLLPVIDNPGNRQFAWKGYPAMLPNGTTWKIYDDETWGPPWLAWSMPGASQTTPPLYLSTNSAWPAPYGTPPDGLNVLEMLQGGVGVVADPAHYTATPAGAVHSQFELDALAGNLPDISWIVPASYLTQHPSFLPADGECYVARIVNAVMNGPDWQNTVLIITYDENDGHFDHVAPPVPKMSAPGNEPWVSNYNSPDGGPWPQPSPVGGGFRVPTIIVSPWTANKGVASSLLPPNTFFDHTSIIQFLEDVFGAQCTNLPLNPPDNWRRSTFQSLGKLIDTSNPPPNVQVNLPTPAVVDGWRRDVLTRLFGNGPLPSGATKPMAVLSPPNPAPVQAWPPLQQQCYFIMDKTTFGQDEVDALRTSQNNQIGNTITGPATFASAFYVVVDGFEPAELNLGPLVPGGQNYPPVKPQVTLTIAGQQNSPSKISINVGPAVADNSAMPAVPQRFRFACDIVFLDDSAFAGVTASSPILLNVNAAFSSHLTWNAPQEQIELVETADPFIQSGAIGYLSTDLRVYRVSAGTGDSLFGVSMAGSTDPISYIQSVIAALNAPGSTLGSSFETSPSEAMEPSISTVTVFPKTNGNSGPPVYNFAIARVTLQGLSDAANNVRVFFRLFTALSTGTAFDPSTLYRRTPLQSEVAEGNNPSRSIVDTVTAPNQNNPNDPSNPWLTRVPLLGVNNNSYVTFPFFATNRVTPGAAMTSQPPDWPNTQLIKPAPGNTGQPVYAFFGCWLDINQATPQFNAAPPPTGSPDGPFSSAPQPISAFIHNPHQCLVAEVAFDPIPIVVGATPGETDRLAQRNLTVNGATG
jgi:phospholipase C